MGDWLPVGLACALRTGAVARVCVYSLQQPVRVSVGSTPLVSFTSTLADIQTASAYSSAIFVVNLQLALLVPDVLLRLDLKSLLMSASSCSRL